MIVLCFNWHEPYMFDSVTTYLLTSLLRTLLLFVIIIMIIIIIIVIIVIIITIVVLLALECIVAMNAMQWSRASMIVRGREREMLEEIDGRERYKPAHGNKNEWTSFQNLNLIHF